MMLQSTDSRTIFALRKTLKRAETDELEWEKMFENLIEHI